MIIEDCLHMMMNIWENGYLLMVTVVYVSFCPRGGLTSGTVTITMPGNTVAPPFVSVKEGDAIWLHCRTDILNSSILWTKPDNPGFYQSGNVLYLERVFTDHGGEYVCVIRDQSGRIIADLTGTSNVAINVLYGPGVVTITGPNSAMALDIVELKCSSSGNPQPSYLWSRDNTSAPIHVVHRGPVLSKQFGESDQTFYCIVENILIPTQGNFTTSTASAIKTVVSHREARIIVLNDTYEVDEGYRLDISCQAVGVPLPRVWWTKAGAESVINEGGRIVIPNVDVDFDGYYSCHAENTVTNATGVSRVVTHMKNTYIQVNPRDDLETTKEHICHGIIAALVIGWVVVLFLILIALWYFIRARKTRENKQSKEEHTTEDQTGMPVPSVLPSISPNANRALPKTPNFQKRRTSKDSIHTYHYIEKSSPDRVTIHDGQDTTPSSIPDNEKDGTDSGYLYPIKKQNVRHDKQNTTPASLHGNENEDTDPGYICVTTTNSCYTEEEEESDSSVETPTESKTGNN